MERIPQKKFTSPEEEIAFLRSQIAERERELLGRSKEIDHTDIETIGTEVMRDYGEHVPEQVLSRKHILPKEELAQSTESLSLSGDKIGEVIELFETKGVRNALSVLEKLGDSFLTDEVHKLLVQRVRGGIAVGNLKENMPLWNVLHMTLFEVSLPEHKDDRTELSLTTLMSTMEQFYSGMQTIGSGKPSHYTLEIAVSDKSDDIIFYVGVPTAYVDLFEKQVLSLFPTAVLTLQQNDYNIFVDNGVSEIAVATLKRHHAYPLKTTDEFEADPLGVILNAFSKIEREGGGASVQLVIDAGGKRYQPMYESIIKRMRDGMKADVAIRKSTIGGELYESVKDMFSSSKKKEDEPSFSQSEVDTDTIEVFESKITSPVLPTNIRIAVSAASEARAGQILGDIESGFNQFESTKGNRIVWKRLKGSVKSKEAKAFSFREFSPSYTLPLSQSELATLIHFPSEGVTSSPQFKQSRAKTAPAPNEIPNHGTLLGINEYRGRNREIHMTELDRMRHLYIIGQTGTGKSVFLKNLITQDIASGAGVCMIDPHGTDIEDVLASVPPERYDDVIYFDPSRTDMVMGLNMLEYDPRQPEQKTFVVNELFSIFQRLYGANPESMGPMFEQYFRNATQLVMEDPESGNTLLDISRVFADAAYRKHKISKARNPVVVQFWQDIATKAGGEAALENIVPYITSKFDVFTANDFMRPIIGQQQSSFNFRKIMDERKILLVNLSKGRLGEINANLIGMIVVGKILMSALSRVDDPSMNFPPFFLHIDEFQNVTTDSIASILSEARKYKLGLTVAHQFIAQLDEKIRDAVFGNVGSVAAFRVGSDDAEFLSHQFEPIFDASDLMNIENYYAYLRVLAKGVPTKPFSIKTMPPPDVDRTKVNMLKEHSYQMYGQPRRKVDMDISSRYVHKR